MFLLFGAKPAQRDRAKNSRSRKTQQQPQHADIAAASDSRENRSTPYGGTDASSAISLHGDVLACGEISSKSMFCHVWRFPDFFVPHVSEISHVVIVFVKHAFDMQRQVSQ